MSHGNPRGFSAEVSTKRLYDITRYMIFDHTINVHIINMAMKRLSYDSLFIIHLCRL